MRAPHLSRYVHLMLIFALVWPAVAKAENPVVRVSILQSGTVDWVIQSILHHGDDEAAGIRIERRGLAGTDATRVALLAGDADIIAGDWIWASRQRAEGEDFAFVPYSDAVGALMVPPASEIDGPRDLAGKRLGIAGGPVDKSWLLLRAVAQRRHQFAIADAVDASYGAPPLLNQQLRHGRLDAVLTFWHYAARLEADGYRRVIDVRSLIEELGGGAALPMIGFVFRAGWADEQPKAIAGFVAAVRAAQARLASSDAEWQRLRTVIKPRNETELAALRDAFRAGIPNWDEAEQWPESAAAIFAVLAAEGGARLVGTSTTLQPGTFWRPAR
ncbi:MAG: transporter substrate-binding domain-containing protein [Alphaproteobacteria bacterium]